MESGVLTAVTVLIVLVVICAVLLSLFLLWRHRKAKQEREKAEMMFEASQQLQKKQHAKKSWKDKLITRKSINGYPVTDAEQEPMIGGIYFEKNVPRFSSFQSSHRKSFAQFLFPTSQGEMRTEAVQPDALKPGTKINQQLRSTDPLKQPLILKDGSLDDGIGAVDISQYQSLLNFDLESADTYTGEPTGKNYGLGSILFAIKYDFEKQNLELRIVRGQKLLAKDVGGTSDPYVKAVITPGSKNYYLETKVKMKTLNPEWKETFLFEGFPLSKLSNKTLAIQVLDFDRFSKDDPIGEVEVQLGEVNYYEPNIFHTHLGPCTGDRRGLGELMVSLSYNEDLSQLTVIIVKARNLKAKDINGLSDPYAKIYLLYQSQRIEKRRSTIRMKDLNPTFNESFQFTVPRSKLKESGLHIRIMDYDRWSRDELIGELILSSRSGTQEIKHWNEALYKQNQMVSEWHALKKIKMSKILRATAAAS